MNWLIKLLFVVVSDLAGGVVEKFGLAMNNIFKFMYELNLELNFTELNKCMVSIGLAFVAFVAVKQGFDIYVLNTEGDSDADPLEMITRISITVATIICGNWILQQLIKLAGIIYEDINGKISSVDNTFQSTTASFIATIATEATVGAFINLLFLVIIIIAFIILIFKAAKRGVEIILAGLILPIIACDLLTTNKERWNNFFTEVAKTIFGYIIQMICFNIFMFFYLKAISDVKFLILSTAWLMTVLGAPKWLEKFIYKSGVGNVAQGGARSAAFIIPSLIRK